MPCLPVTSNTASTDIEQLHAEIHACERCVCSGHLLHAAPRAWGKAPADFMVIGQAPGIRESGPGGEMYLGPAGMKLRGWLKRAGFSDEDFGVGVYMTAITKCFPGRLPGHSKDRAPSRAEQANCRPWLDFQLDLVRPKVIILFGKMAIDSFLGRNFTLDSCVGHVFKQVGTIFVPLPHSSGASTWLNNPAHLQLVDRAIDLIRSLRDQIANDVTLSEELFVNE